MNRKQFNQWEKHKRSEIDFERNSSYWDVVSSILTTQERAIERMEAEIVQEKLVMEAEEKEIAQRNRRESVLMVLNMVAVAVAALSAIFTGLSYKSSAEASLEANQINERISQIEYANAQPYLIIKGGNEDASSVNINNAGGGLAKNIFFLKHYISASGTSSFYLTKEIDVKLALAAGQEGNVNLNAKAMDYYVNQEQVVKQIPCIPNNIFLEKRNWIIIFYENVRGDKLASQLNGSLLQRYSDGVSFLELKCGE